MRRLLRRLEEATQARVTVDVQKYTQQLRERLQELFDSIMDRYDDEQAGRRPPHPRMGPTEKPNWDVIEEVDGIVAESKKQIQPLVRQVEAALGRLEEWESGVPIVILPSPNMDEVFHDQISIDPAKNVTVEMVTGRDRPGFTLFFDGTIDDVLDAGDRDFFKDQVVEADYFGLVSEIEKPGSTRRTAGKLITVYTARPIKDRAQFDHAKTIPHAIFLTNDIDTAVGYAHDLGGTGGRDIYRIRIDDKHLRVTLSSGRVREYQVIGTAGSVPVAEIDRVDTIPAQ
jgi:uncharacterized coiled-coil protein SlyX